MIVHILNCDICKQHMRTYHVWPVDGEKGLYSVIHWNRGRLELCSIECLETYVSQQREWLAKVVADSPSEGTADA